MSLYKDIAQYNPAMMVRDEWGEPLHSVSHTILTDDSGECVSLRTTTVHRTDK